MYCVGLFGNKRLFPVFIVWLVLLSFFVSISAVVVYISKSKTHDAFFDQAFITDPETRRELFLRADNIFIGSVMEHVGSTLSAPSSIGTGLITPYGQFAVKIEENIKGNLGGIVVINQGGRYYPELFSSAIELSEEDQLLTIGETYLFFTQFNEQYDWQDIMHDEVKPGYALILIENYEHQKQLVR